MSVISETGDEILRRCLWTLRRMWYLPLALGLLIGGGVFLARDRAYEATANFFAVPNSLTLEAAELQPNLLTDLVPIDADAGALEEAARQAATPQTRRDIAVSVRTFVGQDRRSVLSAVIKGPNPKAVEVARQGAIDSFTTGRMRRVNAAVQSAVASLMASKNSLETQISALGSERSADQGETASRSGDRNDLAVKLAETNAKIGALQQVVSKPDEIVQVVGDSPVRPVGGRTISALAAGLFGILAGLGVIYVRGYRDRSIRSRRDVLRAIDVAVLGVIPRSRGEAAVGRLAAVIGAAVSAGGSKAVDLVPAGPHTNVEHLVGTLGDSRSLNQNLTVFARRHLDADPTTLQNNGPCVVVARFSSTKRDELEHTAEDLVRSGRELLGVVLIDVPPSMLTWANRNPGLSVD